MRGWTLLAVVVLAGMLAAPTARAQSSGGPLPSEESHRTLLRRSLTPPHGLRPVTGNRHQGPNPKAVYLDPGTRARSERGPRVLRVLPASRSAFPAVVRGMLSSAGAVELLACTGPREALPPRRGASRSSPGPVRAG